MHLVISRCQFEEDAKRLCPSKIDITRCKQLNRSFASFSSTDTNVLDPIKKVEQILLYLLVSSATAFPERALLFDQRNPKPTE